MSDGSTAAMFGRLFVLLAKNPTVEHKRIAAEMYDYVGNFDFDDYEMGAEEAGVQLGLCQRGAHPRYPDDGEVCLWPGDF